MGNSVNLTIGESNAPSIASFLVPRAIAVIGAAPAEQRSIRGMLLLVLRRSGFKGRIAPVNPSHREINGLRCYPATGAVDFPVDLAIGALPAELVCDVVEQCAAAGVRAAIIISSGFAEDRPDRIASPRRLLLRALWSEFQHHGLDCVAAGRSADGTLSLPGGGAYSDRGLADRRCHWLAVRERRRPT
jgi:predicted CoA-binding protein